MPRSASGDFLRQMSVNSKFFEVYGNFFVQSHIVSNPLHHSPHVMTTTFCSKLLWLFFIFKVSCDNEPQDLTHSDVACLWLDQSPTCYACFLLLVKSQYILPYSYLVLPT